MRKQFQSYALMAGITIGFAVWGAVGGCPAGGIRQDRAAVAAAAATHTETESGECESPDILNLHALGAVLIDGDSGRILYGKDERTVRPMASTTKIMTCILALENGEMGDVCTVSANAAAQPKVHLGAPKGTEFCLKDLLYSLMLESHNDSAVMIAEHIGGSVEGFADMMNQKARDIGCKDTFFVTPNGLDATETAPDGTERVHGTTAADLAAILRYCIAESSGRETFLEITRAQSHSFTDLSGKRSYYCANHNAFLNMMEGALTGKTGFTGGAGYSYVAALKDGERTFVIALLGSGWPPHKTYKWADAKTLFQYGKEHYVYRDVYEEPKLPALPVKNGIGAEEVSLTTGLGETDKHLRLLLAEEEQVVQKAEVPQMLEAPVKKGQLVGHVVCTLNGQPVQVYPLYADAAVERWNLSYCIRQLCNLFLIKEQLEEQFRLSG